jgi:hypothetical protein
MDKPQSNELTREENPSELRYGSSALSFMGEVFIGARALHACPEFDKVWLYRPPISVGRRGG